MIKYTEQDRSVHNFATTQQLLQLKGFKLMVNFKEQVWVATRLDYTHRAHQGD